jgi:geranylgeranyl reductase family protein
MATTPSVLGHRDTLDYDVIVVGGGPAGCAFVRTLATRATPPRVLLIDRATFPRDKVCGDALTYEAIPAIQQVFPELCAMTPSASATSRQLLLYPGPREFTRHGTPLDVIPRLELDGAMWNAVARFGVDTLQGARLEDVLLEDGRVRGVRLSHDGRERIVTCRLLVGADGSQSVVRRATGPVSGDYVIHAVRQYARGLPDSAREHVFLFDLEHRGYFWIFPFVRGGERWANVGYGNATDSRLLKERFREYCRSPEAARYLAAARFEGRPVGFPLNLAQLTWTGQPRRAFWGPGYLLLGDAAALIHPLSGEGISFAVESGRIAAEVLLDPRIPEREQGRVYQRRVLERVRPAFLSIGAYCAIRLPMVLPAFLSRAYVGIAWHAHRVLAATAGAVGPLGAGARLRPRAEHWLLGLLLAALLLFWGGVVATGQPPGSPYGVRAVLFVALGASFCLLHARRWRGWRFAWLFAALTLTCSALAETIGVVTGRLFGAYAYGPALQGRLGGLVPAVIPLAWYVVSYVSYATAAALIAPLPGRRAATPGRAIARAVTGALLFVGYDVLADPNHLHRGGWTYPGGGAYLGVPLQNFGAWFVLGLGSFLIVEWLRREGESRPAPGAGPSGAALGVLAYVGLLVHESLYAGWIAGHSGASVVGLAVATIVYLAWRSRPLATIREP